MPMSIQGVPIIIMLLIASIAIIGEGLIMQLLKKLKQRRQKRRDKSDNKNHSTLYSLKNYAPEHAWSTPLILENAQPSFFQGELSRRFLQSEVSKTPLSAGAKELYFRKQWNDLTFSIFQSLRWSSAYTRTPKAEVDYIKNDERYTWELFYDGHKKEFTSESEVSV